MITDIVENSADSPELSMTPEILKATDELRQFMFDTVYMNSAAKTEEKRGADCHRYAV